MCANFQKARMKQINQAPIPSAGKPARRIRMHVKSTFFLMGLLVCAVAVCGLVCNSTTASILRTNQEEHARQLAYAVAATMGNDASIVQGGWQAQVDQLGKLPQLRFALLTDPKLKILGRYIGDEDSWQLYSQALKSAPANMAGLVGYARPLGVAQGDSSVVTVPVFNESHNSARGGQASQLVGYLHICVSNAYNLGQLTYLQSFVLITCMAVVLLSIPIAVLIARHITGPIMRLAKATHALAEGELSHRVQIERTDEIGELAGSFNEMAARLQKQQDDIRRINAGLEAAVQERTAELETVNGRLQAEIAEKEDFLRAVSHDLNAPLRNISGMAAMLIIKYQATLEKDALQRLERIQKNVELETSLINELLELSRIKSRREKIENIDLSQLLREIAEQFSSDFETHDIAFKVTGRPPVMRAEKSRIRQLFQNLIDNAVKYMRKDGPRQITVGITQDDSDYIFTVADTGMGISEEDLPTVFHVFRRAKNASMMNIPGKGVGLASVKSIVDNYNGRVRVESKLGAGTTLFVHFPRQYFSQPKSQPQEVPV
jgi:signal transduction histidine kinase